MYLHLDPNFNPFQEGTTIDFKSFTFSGGEPHIKIISPIHSDEKVIITHRIQSFNDFGLLLLAIDALQRMQVKNIEVLIPYFSGSKTRPRYGFRRIAFG